jgi:hypothetical protein
MTDGFAQWLRRMDQQDDSCGPADLERWHIPDALPWLRQAGTVKTVICPGCSAACAMPVRKSPWGTLTILCDKPEDYGLIEVAPDDLRRWRMDWPVFLAAVAQAFGLPKVRPVVNERLWQLGAVAGQNLFLLRGVNWPDAGEILQRHAGQLQQAALLTLTPAKTALHALSLALPDICTLTAEHSLAVDQTALQAFLPLLPVAAAPVRYAFSRVGENWRIVFEGKEALFSHSDGFTYIQALLRQPGQPVHVTRLQTLTARAALPQPALAGYDLDVIPDDHLPQRVMDRKLLRELQEEIEDLEERGADPDHIEARKKALEKVISQSRATFPDDGEKARDIIRKATNSTIRRIEKHLPACALHLRRAVTKGFELSYTPQQPTDWTL